MPASLKSFDVPDYLPHATRCVTYMPFRQDARRLKQSESKTVLLVEAIDVDAQSRPIVFHEMLCAGICRRLVFGDMRPVASSKAPSIQLRLANRVHLSLAGRDKGVVAAGRRIPIQHARDAAGKNVLLQSPTALLN